MKCAVLGLARSHEGDRQPVLRVAPRWFGGSGIGDQGQRLGQEVDSLRLTTEAQLLFGKVHAQVPPVAAISRRREGPERRAGSLRGAVAQVTV